MQTIYHHITKRIAELGYTDFSVSPVVLKVFKGKLQYDIQAYNELYFLMSSAPIGTRIISDVFAMEIENSLIGSEIRPFYEFSGLIEITFPKKEIRTIDFLRVIPT